MAPCSKRARSRSPTPTTPTNEDEDSNADVGPHETLWHEDGNIVLVTDMFLYRVHKSILANQSSVFRDMFQMPTVAAGDTSGAAGPSPISEEWNGIPTVKMAGDEDEDVYNLLMTLYDRKHYRMNETTTLPILTSLIAMSAKYDFCDIRSEIVQHLMHHFPDNFVDFEKEKEKTLFNEPPANYPFRLLSVVRKLDAPILLPSMFYCCATQPLRSIFESQKMLTQLDFETVLSGRERMVKFSYENGMATLLTTGYCKSPRCFKDKLSIFIRHFEGITYNDPPLFPLRLFPQGIFAVGGGENEEICNTCIERYNAGLKSIRESFWTDLPVVFDLDEWHDLQQSTAL